MWVESNCISWSTSVLACIGNSSKRNRSTNSHQIAQTPLKVVKLRGMLTFHTENEDALPKPALSKCNTGIADFGNFICMTVHISDFSGKHDCPETPPPHLALGEPGDCSRKPQSSAPEQYHLSPGLPFPSLCTLMNSGKSVILPRMSGVK